jgi:pimeloyl-ACP methyl ester carboxylesterase
MSKGPGPYDISQQASDVAAVIASVVVRPAVIVSHSIGGCAVLRLNHYHPELVSANVFVDVPLSERGADTTAMVNALHETGSLMPLTRMVESMVALAAPEVRDVIKDMMLTCPVEVASGMLSNLDAVTNDMTGLVAEVATKPCLAIWPGPKPGGGDPAWLVRTFPSIQQELIGEAGHFVQLEQPETVNLLLARFVDSLASRR